MSVHRGGPSETYLLHLLEAEAPLLDGLAAASARHWPPSFGRGAAWRRALHGPQIQRCAHHVITSLSNQPLALNLSLSLESFLQEVGNRRQGLDGIGRGLAGELGDAAAGGVVVAMGVRRRDGRTRGVRS